MNALPHLIRFRSQKSYSFFVDVHQWYIRNILLFCTSLSVLRLLFGEVIICQNTNRSILQSYLDARCFINGTITRNGTTTILYHDYYQWVSVYLLLLAFGFYLPYWLWSRWFGNDLRHLESLAKTPEKAVERIWESKGQGLFYKTLALEMLYPVQVLLLLGWTDVFFHHTWREGNWSWQTIQRLFPDTADCLFDYMQDAGWTTGKFLCLLPLCSVYRKIFYTLYMVVASLGGMYGWMVMYRVVLLISQNKRCNGWWALTIVLENIPSWRVKKRLDEEWRDRGRRDVQKETMV